MDYKVSEGNDVRTIGLVDESLKSGRLGGLYVQKANNNILKISKSIPKISILGDRGGRVSTL